MGGIFWGASEQTSAKGSSEHPTSLPRPADHLYCAYERRYPESNHTAQKWQSSKTRWHPSRGTKSGHRYTSGDALPALREDLIKLPKKIDRSPCANYKGITLLSISGKDFNRVLLNRHEDALDSHLRDYHEEPILCRSDDHSAHHLGAVIEMELIILCQFYGLW